MKRFKSMFSTNVAHLSPDRFPIVSSPNTSDTEAPQADQQQQQQQNQSQTDNTTTPKNDTTTEATTATTSRTSADVHSDALQAQYLEHAEMYKEKHILSWFINIFKLK